MSVILTKKYRPEKFEDIVGNEGVINSIKNMINNKKIVDMIFFGSFGVGKTSTAIVIAKTIAIYPQEVLFINASDINKKDDIHEYIMKSSNIMITGDYKVIILDEAEELTKKSQLMLKSFLETKSSKIIIIFIVNDYSKIIDAIKSRCLSLKFERIPEELILKKLFEIKNKEHITLDDKKVVEYAKRCNGDLRSAIKYLQGESPDTNDNIDIKPLLNSLLKDDIKASYSILIELLEKNDANSVCKSFFDYVYKNTGIDSLFLEISSLYKDLNSGFSIYIVSMEFIIKCRRDIQKYIENNKQTK